MIHRLFHRLAVYLFYLKFSGSSENPPGCAFTVWLQDSSFGSKKKVEADRKRFAFNRPILAFAMHLFVAFPEQNRQTFREQKKRLR
jgi:hypothetical protein